MLFCAISLVFLLGLCAIMYPVTIVLLYCVYRANNGRKNFLTWAKSIRI